jgi:hypothetical protein
VFAAENAEVDSVKISAPQMIAGIHSPSGASSGGSADKDLVGIWLVAAFTTAARDCSWKSCEDFGLAAFS